MKCAKLHLQERSRPRMKLEVNLDKPRRYCQRRMVNPEEDPRWNDLVDRFCCSNINDSREPNEEYDNGRVQQEVEDLFLTVQNLQFNGDVEHRKRPRTSFKYKNFTDGNKHRMFVKQIVNCDNYESDDRFSELTYYFDDYVKYFLTSERSRPTSAKSSNIGNTATSKSKENKEVQVDITQAGDFKKTRRIETKPNMSPKKGDKEKTESINDIQKERDDNIIEDSKISFHKHGKRKSLTISRTGSPATIQIIRVDVVCNYSSSSAMSDYEDKTQTAINDREEEAKKKEIIKVKNTRFANKYLLTNTVKTLDENVSGGAKVTLLCKTFRLADRSKLLSRRKSSKSTKNVLNTNKNVNV